MKENRIIWVNFSAITSKNGQLKSVIDKVYTLEQIRETHTYGEGFHKRGNVGVRVVSDGAGKVADDGWAINQGPAFS